ncbi:hypothetical protein ACVWZ3_002243 [Bradyrhizobium sp. i1.3.6]
MRKRLPNHLRLFVNLLRHEVAVLALVNNHGGTSDFGRRTAQARAVHVDKLDLLPGHDGEVAVLKVGDNVRQRRERHRIRPQEHFAATVADSKRRALSGTDQEIVVPLEQEGERERSAQAREHLTHRCDRLVSVLPLAANEMRNHFGVGLGRKMCTGRFEIIAQLSMVLDDPIVHDRHTINHVRMRIRLIGTAVRCPAGVTNSDPPGKRLRVEPTLEVHELSDRTTSRQRTVLESSNTG